MTPGQLLKDARRRHYVTQKQLAARARTSQAQISRIERDLVSPSIATLANLLDLMGEELELGARPVDYGHDRALIQNKLARTTAQRIRDNVAYGRFASELRSGRTA